MTTNSATASQPLVDLQRLVVAIRRKRRFVFTFALVGLLAGMALSVLAPAKPTAVTRLLVVHEQDQPTDGGTPIRTHGPLPGTHQGAGPGPPTGQDRRRERGRSSRPRATAAVGLDEDRDRADLVVADVERQPMLTEVVDDDIAQLADEPVLERLTAQRDAAR